MKLWKIICGRDVAPYSSNRPQKLLLQNIHCIAMNFLMRWLRIHMDMHYCHTLFSMITC
jgi:hypothetical protein